MLLTAHHFEFLNLKGDCKALLSLHLRKCHIVGNLMPRLNYGQNCLHVIFDLIGAHVLISTLLHCVKVVWHTFITLILFNFIINMDLSKG